MTKIANLEHAEHGQDAAASKFLKFKTLKFEKLLKKFTNENF